MKLGVKMVFAAQYEDKSKDQGVLFFFGNFILRKAQPDVLV